MAHEITYKVKLRRGNPSGPEVGSFNAASQAEAVQIGRELASVVADDIAIVAEPVGRARAPKKVHVKSKTKTQVTVKPRRENPAERRFAGRSGYTVQDLWHFYDRALRTGTTDAALTFRNELLAKGADAHAVETALMRGHVDATWLSRKNPARRRRNPGSEIALPLPRKNPSRNPRAPRAPVEPDEVAGDELKLYIDNEYALCGQMQSIQKNLINKMAAGKYQSGPAAKLFLYLVDEGARRYTKEFGERGPNGAFGIFDKPTREYTARMLRDDFEAEAPTGAYDEFLQKQHATKRRTNPGPRGRQIAPGTFRAPRRSNPRAGAGYKTMAEIREANRMFSAENGREYWFSRGAMKFFGTKIEGGPYQGRYFITSEKGPAGPRRFAIREITPSGQIRTIGQLLAYPSKAAALAAVRAL